VDSFEFRAESELRTSFRVLGAVTPASALPGNDLPLHATAFDNLLRRGVIREGAPGTFYLYEPQPAKGAGVRRLLFFFAVIILPVAFIQFCSGSP